MITQLPERPDRAFIPIVTLRRSIDGLAQQFQFKLFHDRDDLGPIKCAYLRTGSGNVFVLFAYAYRSSPPHLVDVGIPRDANDPDVALRDIIRELQLDRSDVIRRDLN